MKQRVGLILLLAVVGVVYGIRSGFAEGGSDEHAGSAEPGSAEHHAGSDEHAGSAEHHAGSDDHAGSADHAAVVAGDADGDGKPDKPLDLGDGKDSDGDGVPDSMEHPGDVDGDGIPDDQEDYDEDDPPTDPFDEDGDGKVEPEEAADRTEYLKDFADVPDDVIGDTAEGNAIIAKAHAKGAELLASMTPEKFRKLVAIARKVTLHKMEVKIEKKSEKKMRIFSLIVVVVSFLGLLLLLMPLVLAKKYPGQGKVLFKYSALAAITFIVTVNLFGGVLYGFRTVQGALSNYTNPSIALAAGTFDTLDSNAENYVTTGKELFGPSLEQMRLHPDEQPAGLLLENGTKLIKDAKVFLSIKKMFKKVDFIFGIIPIILTLVTLILFVLAIRPTLVEIVKLPAAAASGTGVVGRDVVKKSMKRVVGELKATICTIGVLVLLTLVSSFVLGRIVAPALEALLYYFSQAVNYLKFVEGASSGTVFVALFGVIVFLVLNLALLIVSMAFFLGKCQKIFQQRFNEGTPISTHGRFFKWGVPSVMLVQLFPLIFAYGVGGILGFINDKITGGETDVAAISWTKMMLLGPLFLVVLFLVTFWAARGFKAIKFLFGYKVKVKPVAHVAGETAEQVPPR
jgi:hypothetical protein